MSKEKQIDYKEFARKMRQVATVFNGTEPAVVCSKELWESIASAIESFAGYRRQSDVAREIFEEIEKIFDNNTYKSYIPNSSLWCKEYKSNQIIVEIAELKKKYTEN